MGTKKLALVSRAEAVIRRLPIGALMVEIGVFRGVMSDYILTMRPDVRVTMVDNWLATEHQPETYRATRDYAAHLEEVDAMRNAAMSHAVAGKHAGRVRILEMSSVMAAIQSEPADLVFIDADHSYEGVKADIAAWLPIVKPGGYIGGHDYANDMPEYDFSGVKRAVDEAFPDGVELDENFTWFVRQ